MLHPSNQVLLELLLSPLPHRLLVVVEVFVARMLFCYLTCLLVLPEFNPILVNAVLVASQLGLCQLVLL